MDTLLTAPRSDDEAVHLIDQVLAQAAPLRARMQTADAEGARLAAETRTLRDESARLLAEQSHAVRAMNAALDRLAAHE